MRKVISLAIVAVAAGAIAVAPTVAQNTADTTVTVDAKVSPNKAGTPKKPKGVQLSGKIKWTSSAEVEPPVITKFDILFGKGGVYNGGKYPKCSAKKLNDKKKGGPDNCPKESIMGSATGLAYADLEPTRPKVTVVNGGAKGICFYTVLRNPARVQRCVPGKVKKLSGGRYRVTITVPEVLLVVTGVPIALREINFKVGNKPYAKDWIATTGCPKSKKWDFSIETFYRYADDSTSSSSFKDQVTCK